MKNQTSIMAESRVEGMIRLTILDHSEGYEQEQGSGLVSIEVLKDFCKDFLKKIGEKHENC